MEIRKAQAADLPAIIELLDLSLGSSRIQKSEPLWKWKHEDNPFGKSPVWVATEGGKLIGVRVFMYWHWQKGQKTYTALRAVDTATHPGWQGKGVFKKLTSVLVASSTAEGADFIFNTPNKKSLPGYLNLGWRIKGNLPLRVKIIRPWGKFTDFIKTGKNTRIAEIPNNDWSRIWDALPAVFPVSEAIHTSYSPNYLRWRYVDCPIFEYGFLSDYSTYLLVYRIKEHPYYNELRITELLPLQRPDLINKTHLRDSLKKSYSELPVDLVSFSGESLFPLPDIGWIPAMKVGPLVTMKDLNTGNQFPDLLTPHSIAFSIGDLELF